MMFTPYHQFIDSYYFLTLPFNPFYFTYDPTMNSVKTSSNIILIGDQTKDSNSDIYQEKAQKKVANQSDKVRNEKK